jgi:hypothetical protein
MEVPDIQYIPIYFFEWWKAEEAQIIKSQVSVTNVTSSSSRFIPA